MAEPGAKEEYLDALRKRFGLDRSLPVQYAVFISKAVRGDFGESLYFGVPVSEMIRERFPASLELIAAAQLISLAIGVWGGVLAATGRSKWIKGLVRIFALLGLSLPNFWIALLLLLVFSVHLKVLPSTGRGGFDHLVMPAFALGWYFCAGYLRLTHSSLLEVLNREYISLARIKGLPERMVVGKHALKNGIIPVVTLAGMILVVMVSGTVAVETVFNWPGLGFLLFQAAAHRDFNTVQAVVLIISGMMVFSTLLVDIIYVYLDPRIRYT
jgi:ABC-type dipeptide/oligopeptide/nickel transport system permease component